MPDASAPISFACDDVLRARERLRPYLTPTPLRHYPGLDALVGHGIRVHVKHENHLPTNSFKYRNGLSALTALPAADRAKGVIATTLGNHGQGVAFAARALGIDAVIVVPRRNNPDKNAAIRHLGATLLEVGADYSETIAFAREEAARTGRVLVHSFTNPDVVAGAGTLTLEILEQLPEVDALVLSVGGGSHAVGAIAVARARKPSLAIYGVQAAGAPAVHDSWHAREIRASASVDTFADGIRVKEPAGFGFPILLDGLTDFVTVTDAEIAAAVRAYLTHTHNLAEGAGAAGLAGLITLGERLAGKTVALVLTGSNIDLVTLAAVVAP